MTTVNCNLIIECCAAKDWESLEKNARQVSQAINKKEYGIGKVIADLRSLLTDTNEENRSFGMKTISSILLALDCEILTESEVHCILEFLNNRLKDRVSVIENSLPGLKAMCHFSHFNFEMATVLFYNVQNEVSIQLFKPEFKQQLYKVIRHLFQRFKSDFVNLGSNFVYGFLQIVDGETSPTCLVDVYEFFYEVASQRKFDMFKEDLFEAVACYFPIIYSNQKNDKHMETKMHLSNLLNRAMAATPIFAEFVIQLALEKLESESIGSKQSCYQLLQCSLPGYSVDQVEPFIHELWTFIRIDSLRPASEADELASQALITLSKLSQLLVLNPTVCTPFLEKVWKDLEISLKSPELNLINSTVSIFIALSSGNLDVFNYYFERTHPILLQNLLFHNISKHQLLCLDALYQTFLYGKKIDARFDTETVNRIFDLLIDHSSNEVTDLELHQKTLLFLIELVCVHRFEEAQIAKLTNYLTFYSEKCGYEQQALISVFELIKKMSIHNCQHVLKVFVNPLQLEIESIVNIESAHFLNRLLFQLNVLRSASYEIRIFNHNVDFLVAKLIHFSNDVDNEFSEAISLNLLETLGSCFQADGEFAQHFHRVCILPLLNHFICVSFEANKLLSLQLIKQFSVLFSKFLSQVDTETGKNLSTHLRRLMIEGNISGLVQGKSSDLPWTVLDPCRLNDTQIYLFLSLIYSYVSSYRHAIEQNLLDAFHCIKSYSFQFAPTLKARNRIIELASVILSQILLRLHQTDEQSVAKFCEQLLAELSALIRAEETPAGHKSVALCILMWTTRSLFIRHHQLFEVYVNYFLQLLEEKTLLTMEILKLVDILYSVESQPTDSSSTQELTPSETFSLNLHQLLLCRYTQSKRDEFLFLFVSHLRFITPEIFATLVTPHLSIILSGLEASQFGEVNMISLQFIENILKSDWEQVQAHVVRIVRSVVLLARNSDHIQTRKKALDCLCLIINKSTGQDLLNLKTQFLASLQPTLGDRKRLVRASAVKVFNLLSMVGQPGNNSKF